MSSARLILTFVALFAFTVQSYLTQTHIHIPGHAGITAFFDWVQVEKASVPHGQPPLNFDPASCPFCQQGAMAGSFVVPAAVLLVLPGFAVFDFVVFTASKVYFRAPSHIWQGRAPPSA